ncbi:beta-microseminoprotein-like [Erpetoichthys calabaricus]|uniref:beta-microseminoprotein-like n=1 Tax=Erpetoichthys calabaricus TaxID=27687 RepID=UPI0010A0285B|nr:beta-microseminoprotein-like [Erpetoichthys calabaricus]
MNVFLCIALGLLTLATLCHGGCFRIPRDPHVPGCKDTEGVLHHQGSKWNDKHCHKCICTKSGIECCNQIPRYRGMLESCKVVVNKDCTHKLVNENGPDNLCVPTGGVL